MHDSDYQIRSKTRVQISSDVIIVMPVYADETTIIHSR